MIFSSKIKFELFSQCGLDHQTQTNRTTKKSIFLDLIDEVQ